MAIRYEQLTGEKIEINTNLCLLGKAKGDNSHKTLANRLASTTLWWIYKTHYQSKDLKSSNEIGRELNDLYRFEDMNYRKEGWREANLDAEIDSKALRDKIKELSERELR